MSGQPEMNNAILARNLTDIIVKAQQADENTLKGLREMIITAVNTFGARAFVTVTAEVLKNNFCIEGCNDMRLSLKQIFNISLEELEKQLSAQKYNLPDNHALSILSADHKTNIGKLRRLRFSLGKLNLNRETPIKQIQEKFRQVQDYYAELDLHIRKEEDVLFPILEGSGMQEHPQSLKEEHKKFREIFFKIFNELQNTGSDGLDIAEISRIKEEFILSISNHIFRETYIFYPATLEFIHEPYQWEKISEGFKSIR